MNTTTRDAPPPIDSGLLADLTNGRFVLSVEVVPPRGMCSQSLLGAMAEIKNAGVQYINIPDAPRATTRMSALLLALMLLRRTRLEPILHYCLRDKNSLAIMGELLAAREHGLRNLFVITGDKPRTGDSYAPKAVFEWDSVQFMRMLSRFNQGTDFLDAPVPNFAGGYCYGAGFNPAAERALEMEKLKAKIDAGVHYLISQPVFDADHFQSFVDHARSAIPSLPPVVAGIWPFASLRNALFLKNNVKGVVIPDNVIKRMERFEAPEDQLKEGQQIAMEMMGAIRKSVQGFCLTAPQNKFEVVSPLIAAGH